MKSSDHSSEALHYFSSGSGPCSSNKGDLFKVKIPMTVRRQTGLTLLITPQLVEGQGSMRYLLARLPSNAADFTAPQQ